jgi:hypothetical protein
MAWEIQWQLGVMQDHKGRAYRIAQNSRGKQDKVYVQDTGAPVGRTIPVPEPKVKPRLVLKRKQETQKQRFMYVDWRDNGQKTIFRDFGPQHVMQSFVDTDLRAFMRSPDCGRTWLSVGRIEVDYFNCWHQEAE